MLFRNDEITLVVKTVDAAKMYIFLKLGKSEMIRNERERERDYHASFLHSVALLSSCHSLA